MMNDVSYIIKLERIKEETGWTQTRISQEIGVTFATLNRWLNGHRKPQPNQLRQIERVFKNVVGIIPLSDEYIAALLKSVDEKRKRYPDVYERLKNVKLREALLLELTYESDSIEGSTLSRKETEAILFDKATIRNKTLIEHLEATNHAVCLQYVFDNESNDQLCEKSICFLHRQLMQGIRNDAGCYAEHQRVIRGVDLLLPHPNDIPEEMSVLMKWINLAQKHPVEHSALVHSDFEAIHPFGDGNGRVGRLIMIQQLLAHDYAPAVIAVNDKSDYYEALEYAQKKSPSFLTCFIAKAILKGYEIIARYEGVE